jgi:hypothetical protein
METYVKVKPYNKDMTEEKTTYMVVIHRFLYGLNLNMAD